MEDCLIVEVSGDVLSLFNGRFVDKKEDWL